MVRTQYQDGVCYLGRQTEDLADPSTLTRMESSPLPALPMSPDRERVSLPSRPRTSVSTEPGALRMSFPVVPVSVFGHEKRDGNVRIAIIRNIETKSTKKADSSLTVSETREESCNVREDNKQQEMYY